MKDDLFDVLEKTNSKMKAPVEKALLEQVFAIVLKHPLDEDRSDCQAQIEIIVKQRLGGGNHDD